MYLSTFLYDNVIDIIVIHIVEHTAIGNGSILILYILGHNSGLPQTCLKPVHTRTVMSIFVSICTLTICGWNLILLALLVQQTLHM